jgi:hypothetical protein
MFELARADVVGAAIDGYVVAARDEARGELFGEGLEPAVAGRDAARA